MDLWSLSRRSLLRIRRSAWYTLFIRILPVNFHVSRLWALVQFNLGTFVRFLRFLLALPLDQTGSPIYYILWHTLILV